MRIIIGLTEHIGDLVACEPVARYLKNRYPSAETTWVVSERYREIVDTNPNVDKVIPVKCLTEWMIHSRHGKYDLVVDLHVNHRICGHCRVPLIKNVGNPHVNAFQWFDYGSILEAFSVGANLPKLEAQPRMYVKPAHEQAVAKLGLPEHYVVIHRTSSSLEKDWSDPKWKELICWLDQAYGLPVVEVGHGEEPRRWGYPSSYKSLINKTSLMETAQVIRNASLFIGVDSGPAHFANAFERPGVLLLGRLGNFKKYNPHSGFYAQEGEEVKIVRNLLGQTRDIEVREVREAVDYLIKMRQLKTGAHKLPAKTLEANPEIKEVAPEWSDRKGQNEPHVLAFYLPQFHPIAENNEAHGVGFTEWTNVIKTKPLFPQHYQPKVPGELGYYDLRSEDVIKRQVELAIEYGLTGFCFYYYYFAGKRLLFSPIQKFLDSDSDFPFCFLWANENWSKRWDGGDKEVIIEQRHSAEDSKIFINDLAPIFADKRYIKVEGKPILMIYKAHLFEDIRGVTDLWREEAKKAGFPGLYLVMVDDWSADVSRPVDWGFDASYEIPSNQVHTTHETDDKDLYGLPKDFTGKLVDYAKFARQISHKPFPEYKRFKTVMAPWDNTARYGLRANVYINYKNEAYRNWITKAYLDTHRRYSPGERIMFVHSWNEWCEGTYIEPDGRYGRYFLEETRSGIEDAKKVIAYANQTGADLDVGSVVRKIDRQAEDYMLYIMRAKQGFGEMHYGTLMSNLARRIMPYSFFVKLRSMYLFVGTLRSRLFGRRR